MSIQKQLSQSASLLSAVDAIRNWRAAALMLASLILAALMFALGGIVGLKVAGALGAIFMFFGIIILFYGANAVGILLMDEARGSASRPLLAAVLTSLSTGHRLILVMLLVALIYTVGILLIALLLFICKVPGLGPLLFAFVFPLSVVVAGVAAFALYAVIAPLAAPAIWSGGTTMQVVARLAAIARQRIVVVILSMTVLLFICFVVGGVIAGIMFTGTMVAGGLSAGIIGINGMNLGDITGLLAMAGGGSGGGGDSNHLAAGALGGSIVWAIALTLPVLVYLRGCCQVYLANIQDVNVEGIEQHLRGTLDAARRGAEAIKAKGEAIAAQQSQDFEKSAEAAPVQASAAVHLCPSCRAPFVPGDLFCGGCGYKLK